MNQTDLISELKKLGKLHDDGVLSEEEFQKLKQKLLSQTLKINGGTGGDEQLTPEAAIENKVESGEQNAESVNLENQFDGQPEDSKDKVSEDKSNTKVSELSKKSAKISKWIIGGLAVCLLAGVLLLIFHKSDHKKALEIIESVDGFVIADTDYTDGKKILYVADGGLYVWNLEDMRITQLFADLDSLKVHNYFIGDNYQISEYVTNYPKEITAVEDYDFKNMPNVIQSIDPIELYRVKWPWILIGKHYVTNISSPNELIDVHNYEKGTIFDGLPEKEQEHSDGAPWSVDIDEDGNLVMQVGTWTDNLPGQTYYTPKYIDKQAWDTHVYIDPELYAEFGSYFSNEPQMRGVLGIPLPMDNNLFRKFKILPDNTISNDQELTWNGYTLNKDNLTVELMLPIYESLEKKLVDVINEELPKKRETVVEYLQKQHEEKLNRIQHEAVGVSDIVDEYKGNYNKARREYPAKRFYLLHAYVERIEYTNGAYKYRLSNNGVFIDKYFYTSDVRFANLSYPCTVYMYAYFEDYNLDFNYSGSGVTEGKFYFTKAELVYVDQ